MRKHVPVVIVVALATFVLAGLWEPTSADAKRIRAYVYPDRAKPEASLVIEDFSVNETIWDEGGVHYLWVHGKDGNFKVPLAEISQIEVLKYVTRFQTDWVRYEVKVTEKEPGIVHTGTVDIRVLRGIADGEDWYYYPATLQDRGMSLWRITLEERVPPTIPNEAPKLPEPPVAFIPPPPPAKPAADSDDDLFARMSLDELNARNLLADVFFDFDKDNIGPDGEATLQRNAAVLKRWPTTVVRIDGYADPRGTNEYNADLGERRANAARQYLLSVGIAANRISAVSIGESQAFCSEQTEACWARNRRGHFVFTAK
jgi:peptidoglycan-associated lipoprotein